MFFSFRRRKEAGGLSRGEWFWRGAQLCPLPSTPSLMAVPPAASPSAQGLVAMVRWWQRLGRDLVIRTWTLGATSWWQDATEQPGPRWLHGSLAAPLQPPGTVWGCTCPRWGQEDLAILLWLLQVGRFVIPAGSSPCFVKDRGVMFCGCAQSC